MIFEFALYACAIVAVLAIYGSHKPVSPVLTSRQDCPTESTPDGWGKIEADDSTEPEQSPEEWEEIEIDEWPTEPMEDEPIDDLLTSTSSARPLRLVECGAHQLRTLGVLEELKGARRWKKGEAIAQLTQLYSPQLAAA